MYPPNPFLQLVPARVDSAIARVRAMVWSELPGAPAIFSTVPQPVHIGFGEAAKRPVAPVDSLPLHYGKLWDQTWFRLKLPAGKGRRWLRWEDEAEATLYVDGRAHYGFDVAHRRAPLPEGTREVWVESVVSQTAIWHPAATGFDPRGSTLSGAALESRNDRAWDVLHDLLVLDDLLRNELRATFPGRETEFYLSGTRPSLAVIPPLLRRLLRCLDDALNTLDSGGLTAASAALKRAFRELSGSVAQPAAVLTGHAHIDLVWLWPERVGEFKAAHTFATAIRLMEEYPEFRFAYSQPASYRAVQRRCPDVFESVMARIGDGRWEAQGATEVESDTLIACGEALVRSFLIGQEGFRALTGRPSPVLWLPDVFGYSGCLPQIMRESGVGSFFTTKLTWNAINPFPYSSFIWTGMDGTGVVSHICQNNGYNQAAQVAELRTGAAAHRQCDVHPEFLAPTGYGDGGGGVTEEMCERVRRLGNLQGTPKTGWGRIDSFFRRLAKLRGRLPVFRGELYLEYHRGTFTTHGHVKSAMREAERALQVWEAARCVAGGAPLDAAPWKRVVFAQFHDYIPGSSIHEVYDEGVPELRKIAADALASAACELDAAPGGRSLFNPLPHPRIHPDPVRGPVILPPLCGAPVADLDAGPDDPVRATRTSISNARVAAAFDSGGRIVSMAVDGEAIPLVRPANELVIFPEHPHQFEAWDIDRQALSLGVADHRKATVSVEAESPLRARVVFDRPLGKASRITIRYSLDAGSGVLGIEYDLDWHEENALLKAVFPTGFLGRDARFGAPFGSVRRPQVAGTPAAEAMWEVPASRWAIVSDDCESEGFFVVTESKYGFSCRDGALGLSLVRSAKITSEDRGFRRGAHPEPLRRTLAAHTLSDIGAHKIAVSIGRFDPQAPREEHPAALADIRFTPPIGFSGPAVDAGFLGLSGGDSLQPAWAAPGGPGKWTLRLHETLGRSGVATIHLKKGFRARRITLDGSPAKEKISGNRIAFTPYKIVSIEISREPSRPPLSR
jgi:alpha-mannosidase